MAKPDAASESYKHALALYRRLLDEFPEVQLKGKTMPYTSRNGHMTSLLTKEGILALRLSKEARQTFVERHGTEPVVQYGAVMKEYVAVPSEHLEDTDAIKADFEQSWSYVGSLKPKPTKKPAKKS